VKSLEFTPNSTYADSLEAAEKVLRKTVTKEDVVVIMGAGDVTLLASSLVKK